jgi:hypothetical protein
MLAANIVGAQWTAIGPRLCREYEWPMQRMPKMLLGQAPRRFGKSVGLGTIMLNYALSVSGCILSAFSTSKRASQKLKAKVLQICIESGYEDWIYRSGEEQLYLRDPNDPNDTTRQMNFYPSNKVIDRALLAFILYLCTQGASSSSSSAQHAPARSRKVRYLLSRHCSRLSVTIHVAKILLVHPVTIIGAKALGTTIKMWIVAVVTKVVFTHSTHFYAPPAKVFCAGKVRSVHKTFHHVTIIWTVFQQTPGTVELIAISTSYRFVAFRAGFLPLRIHF